MYIFLDIDISRASGPRFRTVMSNGTKVNKAISDTANGAINYRPRSGGDNVLGSVRPSVCTSVRPLTAEPFDLRP